MTPKDELGKLVGALSDYECRYLLRAVRGVASGERFWEDDVGVLYNEYVKTRFSTLIPELADLVPSGPTPEGELFIPIPIIKSFADSERVGLPGADAAATDLSAALLGRRSRREFTGQAIPASQLSTLLQYACGTTGYSSGYGYSRMPLRSFPSAGGLQAPEVYVSVQAVDGVVDGLYHYHVTDHVLESLKLGNHSASLCNLALGQPYVGTAAVVFLISGSYERLRWKYGERAYRYMCMDAGSLAENVYLLSEALGLGCCAVAGFFDDAIEELLGIDGRDEMALLLIAVGRVAGG
jgi:SagB-type dehydrogenase family enzyme